MPATDDYKYNIKKMHVIFLLSAVAFTAATLLMLYKDHNDEWHPIQSKGNVLAALQLEQNQRDALVPNANLTRLIGAVRGTRAAAHDFWVISRDLSGLQADVNALPDQSQSDEKNVEDLEAAEATAQELVARIASVEAGFGQILAEVINRRAEEERTREEAEEEETATEEEAAADELTPKEKIQSLKTALTDQLSQLPQRISEDSELIIASQSGAENEARTSGLYTQLIVYAAFSDIDHVDVEQAAVDELREKEVEESEDAVSKATEALASATDENRGELESALKGAEDARSALRERLKQTDNYQSLEKLESVIDELEKLAQSPGSDTALANTELKALKRVRSVLEERDFFQTRVDDLKSEWDANSPGRIVVDADEPSTDDADGGRRGELDQLIERHRDWRRKAEEYRSVRTEMRLSEREYDEGVAEGLSEAELKPLRIQVERGKAEVAVLKEERNALALDKSRALFELGQAELTSRIARLTAAAEADKEKYASLKKTLAEDERLFDLQGREVKAQRAERDVARANRDIGVRDHVDKDTRENLQRIFNELQSNVTALEKEWERLGTTRDGNVAKLAALTVERDAADAELKAHTAELARISTALDTIAPDGALKSAKRKFMEWAIIDGFNSHQKPVQDWLPDLMITLGMTETARFDRCRTCHVGIEKFGAGNVPQFPHGNPDSDEPADWVAQNQFPHPYSSHPRPDVYLTAASPHPLPEFGCSICHDGAGSATSFHNAQHGPNDPVQSEEWHEEFGYFHNHFWEYPMFPKRLREATCLKCHHEVVELGVNAEYGATAPVVYDGWQTIRKYGCFGCHEINGYDGQDRIGPDLRLEPSEEEQPKYDSDPNLIAGKMRKVGPSLKHVAQKVSQNFISYWTENPSRFRPKTRMPRFFGLTNLADEHYGAELSDLELAALAQFLIKQSTSIELDSPQAGYEPDAERGKQFFAERGCLACHVHEGDEFKGATADFGPDLTKTKEKLLAGDAGFDWVYTWIRDPQRYHPRSRMPNLFLEPYDGKDGGQIDPAADIAAFLVGDGPKAFPAVKIADTVTRPDETVVKTFRELAELHLSGKALTERQFKIFWGDTEDLLADPTTTDEQRRQIQDGLWKYPFDAGQIKGDEIELVFEGEGRPTEEQFQTLVMNYLGRRSVSRYGCYGCHDINGFGEARPIGTTLQDWGRKDPSRLAPEHIHEFLHEHGERDGSSTEDFVADAIAKAQAGVFESEEEKQDALRTAFYYDSLIHHGRPGFIFQKLRDPRSYDYQKVETKTYVERLVMPQFPINDDQIEAISTFVLGLVSNPPASKYIYTPDARSEDRHQGEILLRKYNCISCHMTDMHTIEFAVEEGDERVLPSHVALQQSKLATYQKVGLDTLLKMRPPVPGFTGRKQLVEVEDEDGYLVEKELRTVKFRGMTMMTPNNAGDLYEEDDPDTWVYTFMTWEPTDVNVPGTEEDSSNYVLPSTSFSVLDRELAFTGHTPAATGGYAEWLVNRNMPDIFDPAQFAADWNKVPPPLFREGDKVQTDWLYRFLKDPEEIRHTLNGLRMPRFNMSDEEARILANYFAAADGSPYPYEAVPQAEPDYLAQAQAAFDPTGQNDYLDESWKLLTATVCVTCHAVGGREFVVLPGQEDKVTHAPDLESAGQRLRPDWLTVWIANPAWITPYTKMPLNFPANQDPSKSFPVFGGRTDQQLLGARDALLNYYHLLERKVEPLELIAAPTADAAE